MDHRFFDEIAQRGGQWAAQIRNAAIAASILAGLMNCFFGYRLFRLFFACLGFVLGAAGGGYLGYLHGELVWGLVGGLVGGLIGAMALFTIYLAGVFVAGGMAAALLAAIALRGAGINMPAVVLLVPLVLGGAVALIVHKLVIIVASSFGGALGVTCGVAMLRGGGIDLVALWQTSGAESIVRQDPGLWAGWAALGLAGVFVQYRFTAGDRRKQPAPEPSESDG